MFVSKITFPGQLLLIYTQGPILLGCNDAALSASDDESWKDLPQHRDEEQVELDVNRAFVYYPNGETSF